MANIQTKTIMNMQHFHDFYFLQAMKASTTGLIASNPELEFSKPVEKFLDDLDKTEEAVYDNIAKRTFMYLYAACLGEARHARDSVARDLFIPETYRMNRRTVFDNITNYPPNKQNLTSITKVFSQEWRSGYGGEAWENIANALLDYGKIDNAAWIDHVVDLEHNNGTAFSKSDAKPTIMFSVMYPDRFGKFLDYKFTYDILVKKPTFEKCLAVTPKIFSLLQRYSTLFNMPVVGHVVATLDNLTDYVVSWGSKTLTTEKKWAKWVSVGARNKPDVKTILNVGGLYEICVGALYFDDIKREVDNVKSKIARNLGEDASKYLKSKISKSLKDFLEDAKKKCKLPKAENTFSIMPCHFVKTGKTVKLSFNFPYTGYGTQTETGFEVETTAYLDTLEGDGYVERYLGDICLWVGEKYTWLAEHNLEALLD